MTRFELFRRNLWLMLRRSLIDRRARRQSILLLLIVLYLIGYGLLLGRQYREAGPWGFLFSGGVLMLALGVRVFIQRGNDRAGVTLLNLAPHEPPGQEDMRGHRVEIVGALRRLAVVVDRAGVEALAMQGKITAQHAGVCRRRTLDMARKPELWDRFSDVERTLLLSQEGNWTSEEVWPRILQVEDVRVLRWALRIDQVLVPFALLKPDLRPAVEVTAKPEMVEGEGCPASYDLRPAQAAAQTMLARCIGEGMRRGILAGLDPDLQTYYLEFAERMAGDESSDLLIGALTVAKADPDKIEWVAQAAIRRCRVLTALIEYLNGPAEAQLTIG
jgi:hypothetical protein